MKISVERWATFWPDCLPLMREHDEEIGEHDLDEPFDPNVELFAAIDNAGMSLLVSARAEKMVGYCIFNLSPSFRTRGILCAEQSLWFVTKEHRGTLGIRMFDFAVNEIRKKGIRKVYPHHWLAGNSPQAESFFVRRGATELEHVYAMRL